MDQPSHLQATAAAGRARSTEQVDRRWDAADGVYRRQCFGFQKNPKIVGGRGGCRRQK